MTPNEELQKQLAHMSEQYTVLMRTNKELHTQCDDLVKSKDRINQLHLLASAQLQESKSLIRKLRAEIRVLHQRLRDANRGAERNAHIAHEFARKAGKLHNVV